MTDGQTARRTDRQGKNNMSPPEGGRHNEVTAKNMHTMFGNNIPELLDMDVDFARLTQLVPSNISQVTQKGARIATSTLE